ASAGGAPARRRPAARTTAALAAPRVHLQVRVRAQAADLHQRTAVPQPQPLLGAAVGAAAPRARDQRGKLVARCPAAERAPEVDALLGVEAEIEDAVGGGTTPRATRPTPSPPRP